MPPHAPAETIASHGCRTVSRRVEGARARELFLLSEPVEAGAIASHQAESVYAAIAERLAV